MLCRPSAVRLRHIVWCALSAEYMLANVPLDPVHPKPLFPPCVHARFAQPWDGMDFDPLDEYLSSSSSAFSSGDDASKGGGSESGDGSITCREKGGRDALQSRDGTGTGRGVGRAGEHAAALEVTRFRRLGCTSIP